jgi:hypothetical protein
VTPLEVDNVEPESTPEKPGIVEGGAKLKVVVTFDSSGVAPGSAAAPARVCVMMVVVGLVATTLVVPPTRGEGGVWSDEPVKLAMEVLLDEAVPEVGLLAT